jgi:hypothetical protein
LRLGFVCFNGFLLQVCPGAGGPVFVKGFEDAHPEALLELKKHSHTGEIDAEIAGQVADPEDPADVVLRIETDVAGRSCRTDKAFQLVDAQRPRMNSDEFGGNADDVNRPGWIPVNSALIDARFAHPKNLNHDNGVVKKGVSEAAEALLL